MPVHYAQAFFCAKNVDDIAKYDKSSAFLQKEIERKRRTVICEKMYLITKEEEAMQMSYIGAQRTLTVAIEGEIDHHSAAVYRKNIDDEFIKTKAKNIIFDFSKLNFMDSSGIGLIMGRYKLIAPLGGRVFLVGVSPQLDRLISISGIYKIVGWAKSLTEALSKI